MIRTMKRGKMRFFYERGHRIAYYRLDVPITDDIRASIYGEALILSEGVTCLGVNKSHIKRFGFTKVWEFMSTHMESKLADLMLSCLEHDFNVFYGAKKEKVVFT